MEDRTRRDLAAQAVAAQDDRLDTRGQQGMERVAAQGANHMGVVQEQQRGAAERAAAGVDGRAVQGDLNRGVQTQLAGQRNDTTVQGQEQRNANAGLDREQRDYQHADAAQRLDEAARIKRVTASEAARRADARITAQQRQSMIRAELDDLNELRRINEHRAANLDKDAAARIGPLNDAIRAKTAELYQQARPPAAPNQFDAQTNAVAPSYAQPPQPAYPGFQPDNMPGEGDAVQVQTVEEAMSLPPGTPFQTPGGRVKVRPYP